MAEMAQSPIRLEYIDGGFAPRSEITYLFYWKQANLGAQSFAFLEVFDGKFWTVLSVTAIVCSLYLGFLLGVQNINIRKNSLENISSSLAEGLTVTLRAFSTIGFALEAQR
jgi:hypothetical protein